MSLELKSYAVTKLVRFADGTSAEFTIRVRCLFPPRCGDKCGCGIICACWPL